MNGNTEEKEVLTQSRGPNLTVLVSVLALIVFIVINFYLVFSGHFVDKDGDPMAFMTVAGIIIAAGLSLSLYSFLYADNPLFKFAEHIYVGVSVGYLITVTVHQNLAPQLYEPLIKPIFEGRFGDAQYVLFIPFLFGLFMFARFVPKYSWISRYSFAMVVGFGSGLAIPQVLSALLFKQTSATLTPFNASPDFWSNVWVGLIFICVLSVLIYFFFSVKHEGPFKPVAKLGTYFLMISFGASFGLTVMGRISLLIGQVEFLLSDWLGLMAK